MVDDYPKLPAPDRTRSCGPYTRPLSLLTVPDIEFRIGTARKCSFLKPNFCRFSQHAIGVAMDTFLPDWRNYGANCNCWASHHSRRKNSELQQRHGRNYMCRERLEQQRDK